MGDADNDGDMDIFTASDDQLHVYGNLGGSASTSWVQLDDPGNPATGTLQIDLHGNTQVDCFRVADMNGDGFADMVVTMASAGNIGNVSIYRATGMGDWEHVSAVNANAGSYSSGEIYGIDVGQSEGGSEQ